MIALAMAKVWDKDLHLNLERVLDQKILLILEPSDLNKVFLEENNVSKIYFPHWSHIIKEEIYKNFECIIFHMTDLPYGRGGSPLQNLIVRGYKSTLISALRCEAGVDTGPIYLKKELGLNGSAKLIYTRATEVIFEMIKEIELQFMVPTPQIGDVYTFKRRKPEESDISKLDKIIDIYDYIRMLDAEGYPNAFLFINGVKYAFTDANFDGESVIASVRISK